MNEFEDFEITEDILTQIENIEIDFLDKSLNLSSDDEEVKIQPPRSRHRRLRILSTSEDSDAEIDRAIQGLENSTSSKWTECKGNQRNIIPFTECCGMPVSIRTSIAGSTPDDPSRSDRARQQRDPKMQAVWTCRARSMRTYWSARSLPRAIRVRSVFVPASKVPQLRDARGVDGCVGSRDPPRHGHLRKSPFDIAL